MNRTPKVDCSTQTQLSDIIQTLDPWEVNCVQSDEAFIVPPPPTQMPSFHSQALSVTKTKDSHLKEAKSLIFLSALPFNENSFISLRRAFI